MVEWLKKAPTAVIVTVIAVCGIIAVSVLVAYVILSIQGVDTKEFREWITTIGQILVFPFLGITTAASIAGARSAKAAEDQTNGQLAERDARIAKLTQQVTTLRGYRP